MAGGQRGGDLQLGVEWVAAGLGKPKHWQVLSKAGTDSGVLWSKMARQLSKSPHKIHAAFTSCQSHQRGTDGGSPLVHSKNGTPLRHA